MWDTIRTMAASRYVVKCEDSSLVGVQMLDLFVPKGERFREHGRLDWKPFIKPTARHVPLSQSSCHASCIHRSRPVAEMSKMHALSLHADDIVKMGPDAPATYGKEELRASTKPLFDNFTIEMDYNREEIQVNGDWGFARGTFTATMTPKAGGGPLYMDAKTLGIYKGQADGSWKLARNCFNSNIRSWSQLIHQNYW